ncbi:hypothetical protein D3C81_2177320 [compost metagenome]
MIHRHQVAFSQIHHVDVVTHAGTIFRWIITAENTQLLQLADSNLRDVWQQIIRDAIGIFADQARLMGTDWVEVT